MANRKPGGIYVSGSTLIAKVAIEAPDTSTISVRDTKIMAETAIRQTDSQAMIEMKVAAAIAKLPPEQRAEASSRWKTVKKFALDTGANLAAAAIGAGFGMG